MRLSKLLMHCAIVAYVLPAISISAYASALGPIPYPNPTQGLVKSATRGGSPLSKLSPELQLLYKQYVQASASSRIYSTRQLRERFGIAGLSSNPTVIIAVQTSSSTQPTFAASGAGIYAHRGSVYYLSIPVLALLNLAHDNAVYSVQATKPGFFPIVPTQQAKFSLRKRLATRGTEVLANEFDHAGLTGKGVIVGVVDSGIDWKHPDFLKPDGTSRILALWDMTDDTWQTSNGKIGSEPPIHDGKNYLGTLYTADQINAALKGSGKVNSIDVDGHGTACAGTAAGNGNATKNGVSSGTCAGVAPDADLVIVKAGDEGVHSFYYLGTKFIADTAKSLHEPCVINESFGSQDSAHDGSTVEEQAMNDLAGAGKPGVAICAAAGNHGAYSLHARSRFGPKQSGQEDIQSQGIELFISSPTELDAYFSDSDEWGLAIAGLDHFLIDKKGNPDILFITHDSTGLRGNIDAPPKLPANFAKYWQQVQWEKTSGDQEDRIMIPLLPGQYMLFGFGNSAHVQNGDFDLYLPFPDDGSFGLGTDKESMVCTPGNAESVITVGAYNFRKSWPNNLGGTTSYNLPLADLSYYSSPGYRRDGHIKPEIVAPASYTISTLAFDSSMGKDSKGKPDKTIITPDGYHVAWAGTSAATPYTAGVIALMLQKNPTLDADQIKQILIKSATQDAFTGAVPNHQWGYGKLNPAAAIEATPSPAKTTAP